MADTDKRTSGAVLVRKSNKLNWMAFNFAVRLDASWKVSRVQMIHERLRASTHLRPENARKESGSVLLGGYFQGSGLSDWHSADLVALFSQVRCIMLLRRFTSDFVQGECGTQLKEDMRWVAEENERDLSSNSVAEENERNLISNMYASSKYPGRSANKEGRRIVVKVSTSERQG
ncbi:hypothetical protein KEM48_010647 [Puccinia striiformis f. sp. tritici PST-130]|nr:hypothetical protein KEM48_010647 [Puccinia striiformis f. sp. tritici PST-130]